MICRCKKWVINSRRGDLDHLSAEQLNRNYRLCSNHFEESQFMNKIQKNRLIWNAIPTLFDVPNPPAKVTETRKTGKRRYAQEDDHARKRCKGII